jgi:hypothetical protein
MEWGENLGSGGLTVDFNFWLDLAADVKKFKFEFLLVC